MGLEKRSLTAMESVQYETRILEEMLECTDKKELRRLLGVYVQLSSRADFERERVIYNATKALGWRD